MPPDALVPIEGCWVRRRCSKERAGQVIERRETGDAWQLLVNWGVGAAEWIDSGEFESGFAHGWAVQDVPLSTTRCTLGAGAVVGRRELGGRHQVLVQLDSDGRPVWLPYENLKRIKDVHMRYVRAEAGASPHAERLRLKLLAHALENWNLLTGSLDRLDVDPLPHQIQLVHRILSSGNYNWLIADDVGLGKTIEVGLLLAALKRKGQARRVLVISPAGLTRQWQDEMQFKFDQPYEIYGRDFYVNKPEHWKLHDHVIVSLDLAKREEHLDKFRQAGGWDVVVFDEGHKLTRYADGERAQRYRLAEALRPLANGFLLLSGTPHQGYADRFAALLELVRPDLKRQIHTLAFNPEIVAEMILRNRKSEVTDAEGNFIFKGHRVHRYPVEPSTETQQFQSLLRTYLQKGYRAGAEGGAAGRAIGFVMTTYRKLASSSVAAIERALMLRNERLAGEAKAHSGNQSSAPAESLDDLIEGGDEQDDLSSSIAATSVNEFFAFESGLIEQLLKSASVVRSNDEKLKMFLDEIVAPLATQGKKLLVFTEYRATQTYLKQALEQRFNESGAVLLINGSMKLDEKLEMIAAFNEGPNPFLISTEAGGEGLNLHRKCHIMVNYDLPWNPARLVQRIGRLYRYGQQHAVVVLNLHARDSFDNAAIDLMMSRVAQIVQTMAPVGTEFNDRLYADILGDILDNLDFASVLQSAQSMEFDRTREQIDEAIARAQRAKELQDEIFTYVSGYDAAALHGTIGFTMHHVNAFIRGMMPLIGADIEGELHAGGVLEIRLPENLKGQFPEFGQRTVVRISTDRRLAHRLRDVVLLDFETGFFEYLISLAQSLPFDGLYASTGFTASGGGALAAFKLRWQNDQGDPLLEEFVPIFLHAGSNTENNPQFLSAWFAAPASDSPVPENTREQRTTIFNRLLDEANARLAAESSRFKHPNGLVQLAAADFGLVDIGSA